MFDKVVDMLTEFTDVEKENIKPESELIKDLDLNSLDVVNVVVAFEDEFGIEIPDETLKNLSTVGDVVSCLEKEVG